MNRKKTCAGCKALSNSSNTGRWHGCDLGYKQEVGDEKEHGSWFGWTDQKPAEFCPKPRTNKQLLNAKKRSEQ